MNLDRPGMLWIAWDDPNHKDLFSSSRFQFLVSHSYCLLFARRNGQAWTFFPYTAVGNKLLSSLHCFRATGWDRIALDTSTVLCTAVPQVSKPEFLDWAEVNFQCSCPPGTFMCVCACMQQHALARSGSSRVNFWKTLNVNLLRAKQSLLQIRAYSLIYTVKNALTQSFDWDVLRHFSCNKLPEEDKTFELKLDFKQVKAKICNFFNLENSE